MRAALLAVIFLVGCGPQIGPRTLPYELDAANHAHQPLVVELGATWCVGCRVFEAQVLPDPRVQAALVDVHFVRYDVDTPAGRDAMLRTGSTKLPTVLGIDESGHIRLKKEGTEDTADQFLEFLREAHDALAPP